MILSCHQMPDSSWATRSAHTRWLKFRIWQKMHQLLCHLNWTLVLQLNGFVKKFWKYNNLIAASSTPVNHDFNPIRLLCCLTTLQPIRFELFMPIAHVKYATLIKPQKIQFF